MTNRLNLHGSAPYTLMAELEKMSTLERPPLERWDPPLSGDIDIRIVADGSWLHEGTPIERARLVRLFSTILRREASGDFFLVTPVEKWRIQVEDAPFVALLLDSEGAGEDQLISFTTNVHDRIPLDRDHPLRMPTGTGEPAPYVMVRAGLEAKLVRSVYYQFVELAVERQVSGVQTIGVWSAGAWFPLMENP